MFKAIFLALSILLVGMGSASAKEVAHTVSEVIEANDTVLKTLQAKLVLLRAIYVQEWKNYQSSVGLAYERRRFYYDKNMGYESEQDSFKLAQNEVQAEIDSKGGFEHQKAIQKVRRETLEMAGGYVKNFKKEKHRQLAKEVISSWMTALDSVKLDSFNDNLSKFEKASNDLRIELQTS